MKDFGMIKDSKEVELAKNLYKYVTDETTLKEIIFMILHVESKESGCVKIAPIEIQKQYKEFYLNKMTQSSQIKNNIEISSNIPKLSNKSRDKKNQWGKTFNNTNLYDILMTTKKLQEQEIAFKRNIKAAEELKDCTFHPSISTKGSQSKDKCLSLYNLSKSIVKPNEKTQEEIDYERSKKELTFTPTIHR